MKSTNIDSKVNKLNIKFQQLETKYYKLREESIDNNSKLRERITHLEKQNLKQEQKIALLKNGQSPPKVSTSSGIEEIGQELSRYSFSEGNIVKVTNNYKGQYGSIGKIYRITKKHVHLTDIKTGVSITRAFNNVQKLTLSEQEVINLYSRKTHH